MSLGRARLILRGAWHHRRTHAGLLAGTTVGATVLAGALFVGDSVQSTLLDLARLRVGNIEFALAGEDRFFRASLAGGIGSEVGGVVVAPAIAARGSAGRVDGHVVANEVQVLGVGADFWSLAPDPANTASTPRDGDWVGLNERLAKQLGIGVGDAIVVRVERPGHVSGDAPLSGERDRVVAIRGKVAEIVDDESFGRFNLRAGQVPPYNLFLPLERLQNTLDRASRANLLLAGSNDGSTVAGELLDASLAGRWGTRDSELELRAVDAGNRIEVVSARVFLDPSVVVAARSIAGSGEVQPVLTYFVNAILSVGNETPYSMVTAVDPWPGGPLPLGMRDDEIAINAWLGEDLGVEPGDRVTLRYTVVADRRRLEEKSREFRVRAVLPMAGIAVDRQWMPKFPGLADAENCRDWEPGIPLDLSRIRDRDEAYWDRYGGAPKAFVTLAVGQEMWRNRWGELTAVRVSAGDYSLAALEENLDAALAPGVLGLSFQPVGERAIAAARSPVDFAQLFLSFSVFLIIASALLTGMLFAFAMDHRSSEAGLLLALGFKPRVVARLFLLEGGVIAVFGSLFGVAAAMAYTEVILWALANVWRDAVGNVSFTFIPSWQSVVLAVGLNVAVAMGAMAAVSRAQFRRPARELLTGGSKRHDGLAGAAGRRTTTGMAIAATLSALVLIGFGAGKSGGYSVGMFFAAGALLLFAGGAILFRRMCQNLQPGAGLAGLADLSARNVSFRRWRSLTVAMVLAGGVFMVVAVSSFRHPSTSGNLEGSPGTGGFPLLAESTLPVYEDLASPVGRAALAIPEDLFEGVRIVPVRVRAGDDASCLNLNRAVYPRLLGVSPPEMNAQSAFRFSKMSSGLGAEGWSILDADLPDGAVPAIADEATIRWALGKSVGDSIDYLDERGRLFSVRLAGALSGSILQGNIVISEGRLIEKYPAHGGYRMFFIDTPIARRDEFAATLTRMLADRGFSITQAARRLAEFQAVENTYISIFQVLGGLGLLLGTAGLGIVVGRNSMERRSEFATMQAVGFRKRSILRLLRLEHRFPVLWGLSIGSLSAVIAVLPGLANWSGEFPLLGLVLLVFAMAVAGIGGTWLAVALTLRSVGYEDLRDE